MKIKYTTQANDRISIEMDDGGTMTSCYPPEITFAKELVAKFLAAGGTIDPAFSRDDLYAKRYAEVTDKTSALIDAPGYVYNSVPFHTDITAQLNFTALFQVRSGLQYPYVVWDGDGSVAFDNEADLMDFCMGLLTHVETIRRTGKAIRDSLKDMTYEQLVAFVDPRSA